MNVVEMMTALKRVACVINFCPLAAMDKRGLVMGAMGSGQEEDPSCPNYLEPTTASALLPDRNGRDLIDPEYKLDCQLRKRLAYIRRMEQDKIECFEYLLSTDKWRETINLQLQNIPPLIIDLVNKTTCGSIFSFFSWP